MNHYTKQIRKDNQRKQEQQLLKSQIGRKITKWWVLQYWKNEQFENASKNIILYFECINNIFAGCNLMLSTLETVHTLLYNIHIQKRYYESTLEEH